MSHSNSCSKPVPNSTVVVYCTGSLVIQVYYDSNNVLADIILSHGGLECCVLNPVKSLLEVYEDIEEILLVLKVLLA